MAAKRERRRIRVTGSFRASAFRPFVYGLAREHALGGSVLSDGTFQNLRLLASTRRRLEANGFRMLSHPSVPPNDGGVSFSQAAARRLVVWPVTLPGSWVASTKPAAAIVRRQGFQP